MSINRVQMALTAVIAALMITGCSHMSKESEGLMQSYPSPSVEAGWIRDGEPIIYDNQQWYPVDDVEGLLDSEVYQIMEYRGVQVFVEKIDTKPYDRLYTKFSKGKFRYFVKKHD